MEERLRDHKEQQRLWRQDQSSIHSDRNTSGAHRKEEEQELFVDYAFLGKIIIACNLYMFGELFLFENQLSAVNNYRYSTN